MKRNWRGRRARGGSSRSKVRKGRLGFETLESRLAMAVVISEFVADNESGLTDFAGDEQDWIELANTGVVAENIGGWYLTDDSANLTKWQIPAGTTIAAGGTLVIFASSKDLTGAELHTNFSLNNNGEDLALVMPDGTTIADAFLDYPAQEADVSYGRGVTGGSTVNQTLVGTSSTVKAHVPTGENAAVDDNWREIGFNDAGWLSGTRSVGFDRNTDSINLSGFIGRTLTTGEMSNTQTSAYIRYSFNVADKDQLTSLVMNLRFDDGFIAYLNGREIARANFGEDFARPQPQWDSRAGAMLGSSGTPSTSLQNINRVLDALDLATFDLTAYLPELVNGANVLSFHGVNSADGANSNTNRQDFFIDPELTATRATGAAAIGFMAPTPSDDNGLGTQGFVADTNFSVDRGFYDAAFQLVISSATADAQIRYTTDGSKPSTTHGTLYTGPINIGTTTTLRAIAYKEGYTSTNVDTVTYVFVNDVIGQDASYVTQPYGTWGHDKDDEDNLSGYNLDDEADWEMDPQVVNGNEQAVKDALRDIPTMSLVMDWDDLFGTTPMQGTAGGSGVVPSQPQGMYIHGSSSERYASLEYIDPNAAARQFQIDVGVEMQGHSSTMRWNSDKMSIQVKFKFPYGSTELNAPLFGDALFGDGSTTEFDTLILDAGYNYFWHHQNAAQRDVARFVTDQVIADLQNLASGKGAAHGKYVHLYLNGLYWGLYNVHERPDDSFASEYYGGDKDNYDVIKHANQDVNHEYTWVEGGVAAEERYGQLVASTQLVQDEPTNSALYAAVTSQLDVEQFIDYMIVHYYGANQADWSHNNWYATRDRNGGLWRFHAWDQEHAFPPGGQSFNLTAKDDLDAPTAIHKNLIGNAEYKLKFADRVEELLKNGGVLTEGVAKAVYQARVDEITNAIMGESARWGDNRNYDDPYTKADFLAANNTLISAFFGGRATTVVNQFQSAGWLQSLAAPVLNNYGSEVASGFDVTIAKPAGSPAGAQIYFTTDGSDPRLNGGAANPAATTGTGPFSVDINAAKQIKARIKNGSDWSPLIDASFTIEADPVLGLRIVELMYNPASGAGDAEYIEILNTGTETADLTGVRLTEFSSGGYTFAGGTLAPGERIVVAQSQAVFAQQYPGAPNLAPGAFSGSLSNDGEFIALRGPAGQLIQLFEFGDQNDGWAEAADGDGYSLVYIGPLDGNEDPNSGAPGDPFDDLNNWKASTVLKGTPGTAEAPPLLGDYDGLGSVDQADYALWKSTFGDTVTPGSGADGSGNGVIDAADYAIWRNNFGATGAASVAAVSGGGGAGASVVAVAVEEEKQGSVIREGKGEEAAVPAAPALTFALVVDGGAGAGASLATDSVPTIENSVASRVDANLLVLNASARDDALADSGDSTSVSDGGGSGSEAIDPAAVWEDESWVARLGRGIA